MVSIDYRSTTNISNNEIIIDIDINKYKKVTFEEFNKNLDELLNEKNFNYLLRLLSKIDILSPLEILLYTIIEKLWNSDIEEALSIIKRLHEYNRRRNIPINEIIGKDIEVIKEVEIYIKKKYFAFFYLPRFYIIWSFLLAKKPEIIEKIIEYTYLYEEKNDEELDNGLYSLKESLAVFIFLQMYENPKEAYQILRDLYRKDKNIVLNIFDKILISLETFMGISVYPYYEEKNIKKNAILYLVRLMRRLNKAIKKDSYEDFINALDNFNSNIKYPSWIYAFGYLNKIY